MSAHRIRGCSITEGHVDSPYGLPYARARERLQGIRARADLVVHVGDIHSGKQFCTESYDRTIFGLWTAYKNPVIYTPGDNEWTDCNKAGEGGGTYNKTTKQIDYVRDAQGNLVDYAGGDPIANLQSKVVLWRSYTCPAARTTTSDVWYAAPTATAGADAGARRAHRRRPPLARHRVAQAAADGAEAVVIAAQADMWDPEKGPRTRPATSRFVASIAAHTTRLRQARADVQWRLARVPVGQPACPGADPLRPCLTASHAPGYNVPNFHRIVVHGSTFPLEWLGASPPTPSAASGVAGVVGEGRPSAALPNATSSSFGY